MDPKTYGKHLLCPIWRHLLQLPVSSVFPWNVTSHPSHSRMLTVVCAVLCQVLETEFVVGTVVSRSPLSPMWPENQLQSHVCHISLQNLSVARFSPVWPVSGCLGVVCVWVVCGEREGGREVFQGFVQGSSDVVCRLCEGSFRVVPFFFSFVCFLGRFGVWGPGVKQHFSNLGLESSEKQRK